MGVPDPEWLRGALRQEVHDRIENDLRTIAAPGTYLGWPKARVFSEVLGGGQADFTEAVGHLSPADRALLYARYNMRRHLDELAEAFGQLFASCETAGSPTIVDLGCGPFTAGLALANALGPQRRFRYFGVDRAPAMGELGQRLLAAARQAGALYHATTCEFGADLDAIDFGPARGDLTLVVASYLLASPTIDVMELVAAVSRAVDRIGPGPVAILYTNSAQPGPNRNYPAFRDALIEAAFELKQDAVERFAKTRTPADLRYALFYRSENTEISITGSTP